MLGINLVELNWQHHKCNTRKVNGWKESVYDGVRYLPSLSRHEGKSRKQNFAKDIGKIQKRNIRSKEVYLRIH